MNDLSQKFNMRHTAGPLPWLELVAGGAFGLLPFASPAVNGQTIDTHWTGNSSQNWSDSGNWSSLGSGDDYPNDSVGRTYNVTFDTTGSVADNVLSVNIGDLSFLNNGTLNVQHSLQIDGTLNATHGVLSVDGQLIINGATAHTASTITNNDSGTVEVRSGAYLTVSNYSQGTGSHLIVDGDLQTTSLVINNGSIQGGGTVHGNLSLSNGQVFSPITGVNATPSTFTVTGEYSQTDDDEYQVALNSPTQYSKLVVGGTSAASGTLDVEFGSGVTLQDIGQATLTIMTADGGITGLFGYTNGDQVQVFDDDGTEGFFTIHAVTNSMYLDHLTDADGHLVGEVPEPASALTTAGIAFFILPRRRRRRAN